MNKGLNVGAAKSTLSYPEGFFPHKGFRGRYFTGIHDELHVRVIFLNNNETKMLLVSLELGDIGPQWLERISYETGIEKQNIFLTATHTHSAPHIHSTWEEDVIDREMGERFAKMCCVNVIDTAKKAISKARPAVMQFDTGWCDINCNRDMYYHGKYIIASNPAGKSDKTVAVTRFSDAETGKTIALIVNYAIHSLVCFYQTWTYEDSMLVTSDLSGEAMQAVEDRIDEDAVSLFVLGASGDQQPRYIGNHRSYERDGSVGWHYEGREAAFAMCRVQAEPLALEVIRIIESMPERYQSTDISITSQTVSSMGKIEGMRVAVRDGEEHKDGNDYKSQYKEVAVEDFHYTPTEMLSMQLGMFRIGEVTFVTVPAEIVCSIGEKMRNAIADVLKGKVVVISQCNGAFSYITDDEGYSKMTFEALSSHFMPGIAGALEKAASDAAKKLIR